MENISNILNRKANLLHRISPENTADSALKQMCCENVESLAVIDDEENYLGLITEHDINSGIFMANKNLQGTSVRDLIKDQRPHASLLDTLENCLKTMSRHKVHHMPVFHNRQFVGVISSDDILEELVSTYNKGIFDETAF